MRTKVLFLVLLILAIAGLSAQLLPQNDMPPKGQLLPAPFAGQVLSRDANLISSTMIYEEDFDPAPGNWTFGDGFIIGQHPGTNAISGINHAYTQSPYANYADYQLTSPNIALPEASAGAQLELRLWNWWSLESNYDYAYIDVMVGGNLETTLFSQTGTQAWVENSLDLTAFAGQTIQLRFRLTSDGSSAYSGFGFDDLQIWLNEYEYEPEMDLISLNAQNFPFIYSVLSVGMEGQDLSDLDESYFQVYENDVLQTNFFDVTPPSTGAGARLVDIAFQMDNSGSMGSSINAVSQNVTNFINNLAGSGVDSALGLCRYGQGASGGNPILEDSGQLTTNLPYFRDTVWNRNTTNGGSEPGYYAITQSLAGFNWRPGSQKVLIIITDESPNQGGSNLQAALDACVNSGAILFALTYSGLYSTFTPITDATGGAVYDINSSFDAILDHISQIIVSNYIISYRSSTPYYDGVLRNLRYVLNYESYTVETTGSYFPGQAPLIARGPNAVALGQQAQLDNQSLEIDALITDTYAPFTSSATLYYRNFNQSNYTPVAMQNMGADLWSATIPAAAVQTPGIAYYYSATDGQSTSTLPSSDPSQHPFTIAVLPNLPPTIQHLPQLQSNFYTPVNVNAQIFDDTDFLDHAIIAYRRYGQLSYTEQPMTDLGNGQFSAVIPGEIVGTTGVEYYVHAWDNYGLMAASGYPDAPHYVAALPDGTVVPGGPVTDLWWTAENSPYYVVQDIHIGPQQVLTVNPGTEVIFAPGAGLEILGGFQAYEAQFNAQNPFMGWDGIFFHDAQGPITVQTCQINHAIVGLTFMNSSGQVTDTDIAKDAENNSFTGETGILIQGASNPELSDVNIMNYANGIVVQNSDSASSCSPTLQFVALFNQVGDLRGGTGLKVEGDAALEAHDMLISGYDAGIEWLGTGSNPGRNTALLTNIRVRNSSSTARTASHGIKMQNIASLQADYLQVADYPVGLEIDNQALANNSNVLLTNIRVRNSAETSRTASQGMILKNMAQLELGETIIDGYPIGIQIDNQSFAHTANALLTNIRVRNSAATSRTEDYGIRILGAVEAIVDTMEIRDYTTGLYYEGTPGILSRTTPLLTNIRVRNSSTTSRDEIKGIVLKNLPAVELEKCIIYPNLINPDSTRTIEDVAGAAIEADNVANLSIGHNSLWGFQNGLRLSNGSHANLLRSVIWTAKDVEVFGGLQDPIVLNNSTVNASFSDISVSAGSYPGAGNLNTDPLFADPVLGVYYLMPRSLLHNDDPDLLIGALPYDFYELATDHLQTFHPGWNMKGVPYLHEPGHFNPVDVFGEDLQPFYVHPTYTSILQLNSNAMPDTLGHVQMTADDSYSVPEHIIPGIGYWVRNPNPHPVDVVIYGLMDNGDYRIETPGIAGPTQGFFMLSNPYDRPISQTNNGIALNGMISPWVIVYDYEHYSMTPHNLNNGFEIPAWSAFIINANNPADFVTFQYPALRQEANQEAVEIQPGLSAAVSENPDWEMMITATCDELRSVAVLGVAESAQQGYDPMDVPSLPFKPFNSLELQVDNRGWEEQGGLYIRDIREHQRSYYSWDMLLDVEDLLVDGRFCGTLRIAMNSPYKLPAEYSYRIMELNQGASADLTAESLELNLNIDLADPAQGEHPYLIPLLVVVENPDATPAEGQLKFSAENYPNPFNPSTTISYTLPESSQVSLDIYNVKGQKVRRLISGVQNRGQHHVVWNGKDANGNLCSSGFYFYRISTPEARISKKILMLK